MACRSVAQTPAPPMRTTTSVGCAGSGTGRSTNSSGWWYSRMSAAFTVLLARVVDVSSELTSSRR